MDSDFPWVYVAMIFIAFVSWIRARLQEAAELRRAKSVRKKALQPPPESTTRTQPTSPYLRGPTSETRPRPPIPASVEGPPPEVPKTFREFFEILQEQVTGQAEPASTGHSAPPPLPVPVASRVDPPVSGRVVTSLPTDSAPPVPSGSHRPRKIPRKTSGDLNRILKTRGTLREALILKEILDVPVSLRD